MKNSKTFIALIAIIALIAFAAPGAFAEAPDWAGANNNSHGQGNPNGTANGGNGNHYGWGNNQDCDNPGNHGGNGNGNGNSHQEPCVDCEIQKLVNNQVFINTNNIENLDQRVTTNTTVNGIQQMRINHNTAVNGIQQMQISHNATVNNIQQTQINHNTAVNNIQQTDIENLKYVTGNNSSQIQENTHDIKELKGMVPVTTALGGLHYNTGWRYDIAVAESLTPYGKATALGLKYSVNKKFSLHVEGATNFRGNNIGVVSGSWAFGKKLQ